MTQITSTQPTFLSEVASPILKETVAASNPSVSTLDLLLKRRSLLAKDITEPGPSEEQIEQLLQIGSRVPDHGVLSPWRFLLFQGKARADFGNLLVNVFRQKNPDASEEKVEFERQRFSRVPLVIGVISRITPEAKVPEWEQILSSGAVCQNILIAANAMGFASQWLTEWYAYDEAVIAQMGLTEHEKIAGFVYIGTPSRDAAERRRASFEGLVEHWTPQN